MSALHYEQAARRAGQWLVSQQDEHGLLPRDQSLTPSLKCAWALREVGQVHAANRLVDGIRRFQMSGPGEFFPAGEMEDFGWRAYYNAIFLVAAARLGRFEIASPQAADRLCAYQLPCGGFVGYLATPPSSIDLCVTAQCGWACLALGRIEAGRRTANFLAHVFEIQPDIENRLYFTYDLGADQLRIDPPAGQTINYFLDTQRGEQHFFYAGVSAGYLADMYALTGESRYLEAACGYIDFDLRTNPEGFRWPSKCKVGWGAAKLYRVTGETKHRDLACRVADETWLNAQTEEGHFGSMVYPTADDGTGLEFSTHELAAEFCYELMEVAGAIAVESSQPVNEVLR